MRDLNSPEAMPSPIHHRPEKDLTSHAKSIGKHVVICPDCGTQVMVEPAQDRARCWVCRQPKPRRAP